MSIEGTMKRFIPQSLRRAMASFRDTIKLRGYALKDAARFHRNYAYHGHLGLVQLESRVMFYTHQIEKGLTFEPFGYGHGRGALHELAQALPKITSMRGDEGRNGEVYRTAVAALRAYRDKHVTGNHDVGFFDALFRGPVLQDILALTDVRSGGSIEMRAEDKVGVASLSFLELVDSRHSIRTYSSRPISSEEVLQALEPAMRTPSVCNRQPARLHIITDSDLIAKALRIQGGFNGYAVPPCLLLITSDLRAFMSVNEHNEGYVDGGLFGMSVLYALEAAGFAACPLNTMFNESADTQTRLLLDIPDNEVFIMYVAMGHFPERAATCVSHRLKITDITVVHE